MKQRLIVITHSIEYHVLHISECKESQPNWKEKKIDNITTIPSPLESGTRIPFACIDGYHLSEIITITCLYNSTFAGLDAVSCNRKYTLFFPER